MVSETFCKKDLEANEWGWTRVGNTRVCVSATYVERRRLPTQFLDNRR